MTRQDMRADLAKVLKIPADAISDDANLMDLGLDSMHVMDLLLRWQASGLRADFSRFFEAVTFEEWWQAAQVQVG